MPFKLHELRRVDERGVLVSRGPKDRQIEWEHIRKISLVRQADFGPHAITLWLKEAPAFRWVVHLSPEDGGRLLEGAPPEVLELYGDDTGEARGGRELAGLRPTEAHDRILEWLRGEKVKVVEDRPPGLIRSKGNAAFGPMSVWRFHTFRTDPTATGTLVSIILAPTAAESRLAAEGHGSRMEPEVALIWLEGLWRSLGVRLSADDVEDADYRRSRGEDLVREGKRQMWGGLAASIVAFVIWIVIARLAFTTWGVRYDDIGGLILQFAGFGILFPMGMYIYAGFVKYHDGRTLERRGSGAG